MNLRIYFAFFLFCFTVMFGYSAEYPRIISLAPSLTKMIYLLEAQENLVGCTGFCEQAKADGKEIVASQMSVNVEKILTLSPDVVITTDLIPARDMNAMKRLEINVEVFKNPASFKEICDQFILLGEITGREDMATAIVGREKARLKNLQNQIPESKRPAVFMQLGVKPLFSVIPGTFMDEYITLAGGDNVASGLSMGTITRETVLVRNPDVILIVLMGIVGKEEKQNWESYKGLKAAENDKILLIDADQACSPTPVTFMDTVEEIIKFVY